MALRSRARAYLRGPEIGPRPPAPPLSGAARIDRRTKNLVKRLRPGEIAVIDHADLDRIAAEDLVACGALAVVNVAESCTGRYPNAGPLVLANAGVRLVDVPNAPLFDELSEGDQISVVGAEVRRNGSTLASGRVIDLAAATEQLEHQRELIDEALVAFAENTMEHARDEVELLSGKIDLPTVRTSFRGRHALIVVRGTTYRRDLRALRAYIEDTKPILVGVDGGADAILEEGFTPDVVLGDMDSATDAVLGCGAELLVHAYPDGRAPGEGRLERLGL
jgi:uncharacterized membrane-anchored protein